MESVKMSDQRSLYKRVPRPTLFALVAALLAAFTLSACNDRAFVTTPLCALQTGPGFFYIPPKLDLVLVEDDTGSMDLALTQLQQQMPGFLSKLESMGWDYRFATVPLTRFRDVTQVLPSKYDGNWYSLGQWKAPFPGASPYTPAPVPVSAFRQPGQYTDYLSRYDLNTSVNGNEPGFSNMTSVLGTTNSRNNLHRNDSLLAVFMAGNGDDNSGVAYCPSPSAGMWIPCTGAQDTRQSSFNQYLQSFRSLKASPALFQFHAAVSYLNRSNCATIGGSSKTGSRYIQMAQATGGASYDICTTSISSVLDQLSNSLKITKEAYRTRYIVLDRALDENSVQSIEKNSGCNGGGTIIPHDATNGWTYAGYVTNVNAIDYPIGMNPVSGYAIELHGTGRLEGDESLHITYKVAGAQNASTIGH